MLLFVKEDKILKIEARHILLEGLYEAKIIDLTRNKLMSRYSYTIGNPSKFETSNCQSTIKQYY